MSKLLYATLFSLLLFVGLHVSVDAVLGSAEEKSRRDTCACLVKEPHDSEESDSNEEACAPWVPKAPTSPATSSSGAPTSSSAAPTSSSGAPTSSSAAPSSSSSPAPSSSSSPAPSSSSSQASTSGASSSSVSPSTPLPRYHSRCRLKHALVNISLTLTGTLRIEFDLLIQQIEDEILSNRCGCMSEDDKVVKVSKKMKKFLSKHKTLKKAMHFKKIGKWGHWRDLVQVAVDIQNEKMDELLLLDVNDNCKLFEALKNHTCGNVTVELEKEVLIVNMRKALKNNAWSKKQKHAKLHLLMRSFLTIHVDIADCIDDIEVEGLGDIGSFRRVMKVAHQTTRLAKVISGSSNDDCELLKRLNECANNASIEPTQRASIGQLHGVILVKFQIEVDLQIRLQYVSQQSAEMLQGAPWVIQLLMEIEMKDNDEDCGCDDGKWGDFYELRFCSHMCTNDGSCGEVAGGEGTDPTGAPTSSTAAGPTSSSAAPSSSSSSAAPSSSSPAPSSSSSAAPSSSSSAAPSSSSSPAPSSSSSPAPSSSTGSTGSTVPPVVCGDRSVVVVKNGNSHGNASILEYSIQVVFDSWGVIQRSSYSSTKVDIKNVILNDAMTMIQKINKIVDLATNYSKSNLVVQDRQMNIPMLEGSFHGKIRDFCACGYA